MLVYSIDCLIMSFRHAAAGFAAGASHRYSVPAPTSRPRVRDRASRRARGGRKCPRGQHRCIPDRQIAHLVLGALMGNSDELRRYAVVVGPWGLALCHWSPGATVVGDDDRIPDGINRSNSWRILLIDGRCAQHCGEGALGKFDTGIDCFVESGELRNLRGQRAVKHAH